MESIIFKDSPLADYLLEGMFEFIHFLHEVLPNVLFLSYAGIGELDASVEPSSFVEPVEPTHSFAPATSLTSRLSIRGVKALGLSGAGWSSKQRPYLVDLLSVCSREFTIATDSFVCF